MTQLEYLEIYPKVYVYKNILKDINKMYEVMKKSDLDAEGKYYLAPWELWAKFGTYTQPKHEGSWNKEIEEEERFKDEKWFADQAQEAYNLCLEHYVNSTSVELPQDWRFGGMSFSKYFDQVDVLSNKMTMQYHTDHITSEKDMPGEKFFITCTMYINDDYDGGDIEFYVDGNLINHKPQAGDILIFPSTEPYYHGVKTISNGEKFFIRNFVMTTFEGTKEWMANQLKFGAHRWAKKEFERLEYENPRNMRYLIDGVPKEYEEVQKAANRGDGKE